MKIWAIGIEYYLAQNGYVDRQKNILDTYREAKAAGTTAELPDDLLVKRQP